PARSLPDPLPPAENRHLVTDCPTEEIQPPTTTSTQDDQHLPTETAGGPYRGHTWNHRVPSVLHGFVRVEPDLRKSSYCRPWRSWPCFPHSPALRTIFPADFVEM